MLAILQVLVVGVGLTSAADLRQLSTAHGTARAFVEAAFASDCDRYLGLLTRAAHAAALAGAPAKVATLDPGAPAAARACAAVARPRVGVLAATQASGDAATALVQVDASDGSHELVRLIHTGGHWRVTLYTPDAPPILGARPTP